MNESSGILFTTYISQLAYHNLPPWVIPQTNLDCGKVLTDPRTHHYETVSRAYIPQGQVQSKVTITVELKSTLGFAKVFNLYKMTASNLKILNAIVK